VPAQLAEGGREVKSYYADDRVTLYCGDALEVMAGLPDGSVDAVLTDPPYSSGGRRENARSVRRSMTRSVGDDDWIRGDGMSTVGYVWFNRLAALQWRRLLVPGGHALAFVDWRMEHHLAGALEAADLRQHPTLVWDKTYFGMGAVFRNQYELIVHFSAGTPRAPYRRDVGNVLGCPPVRSEVHPNEKPVGLLRTLLSVVAAPGDDVLDCMAGSGSTLLAARSLGMRAIGIEAEERHCETIARSLSEQLLPEPTPDPVVQAEPALFEAAS
jgi:site-specific DNA-methyltransferase (adenine-specific)